MNIGTFRAIITELHTEVRGQCVTCGVAYPCGYMRGVAEVERLERENVILAGIANTLRASVEHHKACPKCLTGKLCENREILENRIAVLLESAPRT